MKATTVCLLCALTQASALVIGAAPPVRIAAAAPRAPAASMGLIDWLGDLLYDRAIGDSIRSKGGSSGASSSAVSRLKVVLAHDRTGLDEFTMAKIRAEIQEVISKYVIIEEADVMFNLEQDDSLTLVTASFPLKGARARATPLKVGGGGDTVDLDEMSA